MTSQSNSILVAGTSNSQGPSQLDLSPEIPHWVPPSPVRTNTDKLTHRTELHLHRSTVITKRQFSEKINCFLTFLESDAVRFHRDTTQSSIDDFYITIACAKLAVNDLRTKLERLIKSPNQPEAIKAAQYQKAAEERQIKSYLKMQRKLKLLSQPKLDKSINDSNLPFLNLKKRPETITIHSSTSQDKVVLNIPSDPMSRFNFSSIPSMPALINMQGKTSHNIQIQLDKSNVNFTANNSGNNINQFGVPNMLNCKNIRPSQCYVPPVNSLYQNGQHHMGGISPYVYNYQNLINSSVNKTNTEPMIESSDEEIIDVVSEVEEKPLDLSDFERVDI